jgi:uncharacterized membrane protein YheB (UPF0754 family)
MIFLKALSFVLLNAILGFLIPYSVRYLLFFPRSEKRIAGHKVPLTPGVFPRLKGMLIAKLEGVLSEYLQDAYGSDPNGRIRQWEDKMYQAAWDRLAFIDTAKLLTQHMKDQLRHGLALVAFEVTKQFLRSFVPFLMEKYNVEHYIDLIDEKLDVAVIQEYHDRYVFKYLAYFFTAVYALIGVANMIYYLIIQ